MKAQKFTISIELKDKQKLDCGYILIGYDKNKIPVKFTALTPVNNASYTMSMPENIEEIAKAKPAVARKIIKERITGMMQDHIEGIWDDLGGKYFDPDTEKKIPFESINVTDDNKITHLIFKKGNTLMSSMKSFLKMD